MLYYKLFHVGYIESHEILKDDVVHVYSYVGSTHSIMMADLTEAYVWFLIFILVIIRICICKTKCPTKPVLQTVKCKQTTNNNFYGCYSWFINYFETYNLLLVYHAIENWIRSHCIASFCIRRHKILPHDNRQISDRLLRYRTFKDWIKTHSFDKLVSYLTSHDEILPR